MFYSLLRLSPQVDMYQNGNFNNALAISQYVNDVRILKYRVNNCIKYTIFG